MKKFTVRCLVLLTWFGGSTIGNSRFAVISLSECTVGRMSNVREMTEIKRVLADTAHAGHVSISKMLIQCSVNESGATQSEGDLACLQVLPGSRATPENSEKHCKCHLYLIQPVISKTAERDDGMMKTDLDVKLKVNATFRNPSEEKNGIVTKERYTSSFLTLDFVLDVVNVLVWSLVCVKMLSFTFEVVERRSDEHSSVLPKFSSRTHNEESSSSLSDDSATSDERSYHSGCSVDPSYPPQYSNYSSSSSSLISSSPSTTTSLKEDYSRLRMEMTFKNQITQLEKHLTSAVARYQTPRDVLDYHSVQSFFTKSCPNLSQFCRYDPIFDQPREHDASIEETWLKTQSLPNLHIKI